MIKGRTEAAILVALLALTASAAGNQFFNIYDLGSPTNQGSYSAAHGIDQLGNVAGEWEPTNNAFQHGFIYTGGTNGVAIDVGSLGGAYAIAFGVNSGRAVGESAANHQNMIMGFVYSNGTIVNLGAIAGNYSSARAMNSQGDIVGQSTTSGGVNNPNHAVLWSGTNITDLGTLSNGDYSLAYGINDSRVIVGQSSVITGGVTSYYGFVYSNGVMSALSTLGSNYSSAFAINNSGVICGEAAVTNGDTHACIWRAGVIQDLGTFGGNYSTALSINNAGQVVGYSLTPSGTAHAFFYNGTNVIDLDAIVTPGSTWTNLVSADGINDAGQIAGSALTSNGLYHAYLLIPRPQPTAPLLSGLGILPDGTFQVSVQGTVGTTFTVQYSSDLTNWTLLCTNLFTSNVMTCVDTNVSALGYQFYRAFSSSPP